MLHRAVDARRKLDLITDHDKSRIQVSYFRRQLRDVGGPLFLFELHTDSLYNRPCPPENYLIYTDNHTHSTSFPMPYLPLSSNL